MVKGGGFEPPYLDGAVLQTDAFSHFATPPSLDIKILFSEK